MLPNPIRRSFPCSLGESPILRSIETEPPRLREKECMTRRIRIVVGVFATLFTQLAFAQLVPEPN
jgi:hypothetical protein